MNIALTTPDPMHHPLGHSVFDPSPAPLHPDDHTLYKATHVLGNMLLQAADSCLELCQVGSNPCACGRAANDLEFISFKQAAGSCSVPCILPWIRLNPFNGAGR